MQQPREVAVGELTLGRAIQIEHGRGRPATKQELAELAAFKKRMEPVLRKLLPSKREASKIRRGMAIYRGLSPIEQLRWRDRTPAELLGAQTRAPRRASTTSRARPRGRRATVRASRAGPSDDDEPGGAGLPRLRVITPDRFRRDVDAWLGAA
jgi:hypothetical protein